MSKAKNVHKASSKMEELLKEKDLELKEYHPGDLVEGVVVSVSHGEILMDIGAKSEGIISGPELVDSDNSYKNLKPGDKILAMVVQAENEQGYIVLSLKRAEKDRKWRTVEEAFEDSSILEATVLEYNKGGLLVDCIGLRGFVPLSHLDRVHFTEDLGKYASGSDAELKEVLGVLAGKTLKVKAIEVDRTKNRLVLSEKDALGDYSPEAREKKLQNIEIGDVMNGVVTGIMNFGIFVDLDGIEGLVHISEIAWEKVNHPGDYYQVGSPIEVKVVSIDEESKKLGLSVKQLTDNPWETVEERYPVGTKISGTVSKIVPFGAFVNLEKGLDGLIHVSETDGPLEEGQKVTAIVTQVDGSNQKLALSVRQLSQGKEKSKSEEESKSKEEDKSEKKTKSKAKEEDKTEKKTKPKTKKAKKKS
jgi:small subunit ribosomal protein S1